MQVRAVPERRARLRTDRRAVTAIEFGIVAPVMILLLLGLMDLGYQSMIQAMLTGATQKAGRDGTLQRNALNGTLLDAHVLDHVRSVAPGARFAPGFPSRLNYDRFGVVGPERYSDANNNNRYDLGECFDDVNGNGRWDAEPGRTGQGGASEVTIYRVSVTYPRLFPMGGLLGWPTEGSANAQTLLRNQPYARLTEVTVRTRCGR